MRQAIVIALFTLVMPAAAFAQSARFDGAYYQEDKVSNEYGLWIKGTFNVHDLKDKKMLFAVYFYDANHNKLKDRNGEYKSTDGQVSVSERFTPLYTNTKFTKFKVFIPDNELHVGAGRHDLRFKISLFRMGYDGEWKHLKSSGFYKLPWNWKIRQTGDITKKNVDYNHEVDGENGIKITVNYTIRGAKGMKGRMIYSFYGDRNQENFITEKISNFTAKFDSSDFTGGWGWVGYDSFPTDEGKTKFYYKVTMQVQDENGDWYTLDTTDIRSFTITVTTYNETN